MLMVQHGCSASQVEREFSGEHGCVAGSPVTLLWGCRVVTAASNRRQMSICNVPATGALGFYSEPANEGSVPPHRASRLPNAWVSNETLLAPSGRLRD